MSYIYLITKVKNVISKMKRVDLVETVHMINVSKVTK